MRIRLKPEERKEQLLKIAKQEIEDKGFQRLTVPGIVKSAGISQGSFYRYFQNIDDVFIALFHQILIPPFMAACNGLDFHLVKDAEDLETALFKWYISLADLISLHNRLIREALCVVPYSRGHAAEEVNQFLQTMRSWAEKMYGSVSGVPPFRQLDVPVISNAVVGMVIGAAIQATHQDFEPEAWAREMSKFETGGLLLWP